MRQQALDIRRARRAGMTGQRETLDGRPRSGAALAALAGPVTGQRPSAAAGDGYAARCRQLQLLRLAQED